MRRPMTRLAYCTGIRRWPSWMNTTAAITARARNGMPTLKTWSGFVHHACTPCGKRATIDAKIISEMPLPMPRCVMSSPIHISSTVPDAALRDDPPHPHQHHRARRERDHDEEDVRRVEVRDDRRAGARREALE